VGYLGCSWCGRCRASHRMRGQRNRSRRKRSRGSCRRNGLPGSGQNLARTRCGNRTRGNWRGSHRGMQRRYTACGQRRPQGRRFAANWFFNRGGNNNLRGRNWSDCFTDRHGGLGSHGWAIGYRLRPHMLLSRKLGGVRELGRARLGGGRLGNRYRAIGFLARVGARLSTQQPDPKFLSDIFVNGAGVRLLFRYTELRQHVDDRVGGNFELPGQLVDSNFRHNYCAPRTVAPSQSPPSSL
jgi:hypothetical protein